MKTNPVHLQTEMEKYRLRKLTLAEGGIWSD